MKPATKQFTFKTIQAFDSMLGLARERLSAAVSLLEADDLAGAAAELHAAGELAVQAWGGARGLAESLDAEAPAVPPASSPSAPLVTR